MTTDDAYLALHTCVLAGIVPLPDYRQTDILGLSTGDGYGTSIGNSDGDYNRTSSYETSSGDGLTLADLLDNP